MVFKLMESMQGIFYICVWVYIGQDYFRRCEANILGELQEHTDDAATAFKLLFLMYLIFWPLMFLADSVRFLWIKLGEA